MKKYDDNYNYDNGFKPKEVTLKNNYKFYNRNPFFILMSIIVIELTRFFLFFYKHLFLGLKISGKKNIKKQKGVIFISNHVMPLDAFFIVLNTFPSKTYITVLQSNLGFPFFSRYIRFGGAVPIPTDKRQFVSFTKQTKEILQKGKNVLLFPEAKLNPFCDHIREFEIGAFHLANKFDSKIIPIVYTFHKPKGIYKLFRRNKPQPKLNFLPPYIIKQKDNPKETIEATKDELHKIMADFFTKNSDFYY